MTKGLIKVDPTQDSSNETDHDLAYYRSLTTAERFRMIVERSILLLRLAAKHEAYRKPPALSKRS